MYSPVGGHTPDKNHNIKTSYKRIDLLWPTVNRFLWRRQFRASLSRDMFVVCIRPTAKEQTG